MNDEERIRLGRNLRSHLLDRQLLLQQVATTVGHLNRTSSDLRDTLIERAPKKLREFLALTGVVKDLVETGVASRTVNFDGKCGFGSFQQVVEILRELCRSSWLGANVNVSFGKPDSDHGVDVEFRIG